MDGKAVRSRPAVSLGPNWHSLFEASRGGDPVSPVATSVKGLSLGSQLISSLQGGSNFSLSKSRLRSLLLRAPLTEISPCRHLPPPWG